ncbi:MULTISPECIES: site-specific integrase [Pectobacterium]|uniref:site-specific integrase n=1 Tax=Pectobacterium TaxID=122277 RepID=UPI0019D383B8|nr:site-specific integrase [Pectobacterium brasiliense]MBN7768121.1 site-specific integrase [Pectobacterium brasiliense]
MNKVKENKLCLMATRSGYSFSLSDTRWHLDKDNTVNVYSVLQTLTPSLHEGYLNTLAFFACKKSASYVMNINNSLKRFIREMSPDYIDESAILNYRASPATPLASLMVLRSFLIKWHSLGYAGIDDNAITLLKAMRIKVKAPGDVVKQESPERGPLTDMEHKGLNRAIHHAGKNGRITLSESAMALLVSLTGRRPLQITSLKYQDIKEENNSDSGYFINFPRIKQGGGFRTTFRLLNVDKYLFDIVRQQAEASVSRIEKAIGRALQPAEKEDVPVFLCESQCRLSEGQNMTALLASDRLHASRNGVNDALINVVNTEQVISERTGEIMKISPQRLRYTLGTRMARDGYDVQYIAELLDHSSTACAGIYVENLPDSVVRINDAVSDKLSFIADVFLGKEKPKVKSCSSCATAIPCHQCLYFRPFTHQNNDEVAHG